MAREGRPPGRRYWLISKSPRCVPGTPRIFSMELTGQGLLPVFSFGEEAEMFLKLRDLGEGWTTRETGSGELLSMFFSSLRGVQRVALDPLPEIRDERIMTELVSVSKKRFMDHLLREERCWLRGRDPEEGRALD